MQSERDLTSQRYTKDKEALREVRRVAEEIRVVYTYVLWVGDEISYWRDLYYAVVPLELRARSFRRASQMTNIGGRERHQASSGGVMGPLAPPGGGDRGGEPGAGTSRAHNPLRPFGSERGSSS